MFSINLFNAGLNTHFIGKKVKYIEETSSTNDIALDLLDSKKEDGTLIITDCQKNGRGRRQNQWIANPKESLTFSFILFPQNNFKNLGILPLLTGVSIVKGLKKSTNINVGLKWPNDIMLNGKKLGGVLIETKSNIKDLAVIIGIGLNINESENNISKSIKNSATSLLIDSGKKFEREFILSSILNEFENYYLDSWNNIISIWEKYCIHSFDKVTFHNNNEIYSGTFEGITNDGCAKVLINGSIQLFSSGLLTI